MSERDAGDVIRRAESALLLKVARTKRAIRQVDLISAFCAYATLGLALLFLGVLLDHWILAKGFSVKGRLYFAVFWCVATAAFLIVKLIPVVKRRVNSLYAAKALEDSSPNAHNLIINWFLLRRDRANPNGSQEAPSVGDSTLQIVALQASQQSHKIVDEATVDFAPIIRWGIAFAAVVAVCAAYAVLSPKNLFISVGRLAAPFAKIERPQALRVEKTTPGNAVVYQGDFVDVEATIPGSKDSSKVEVLYSAEDGRFTELAEPMEAIGNSKFRLKFPNDKNGVQENLLYCVVVARNTLFESRSETFLLEARPEPSFQVEKTTLNFPEYSGLAPQTFDRLGDVRALENTRVQIVARANQPLKRAYLLPDGERTRAIAMPIDTNDPTRATVEFLLKWKDSTADEKTPEFSFYQIVSSNENDEPNRDVNDYAVSIIDDMPPTIQWSEDAEEKTEVPVNSVLRVRFNAEDPDYSIRRVLLQMAFANLEQGGDAEKKKDPEPIELKLRGAHASGDYAKGPTPFVGVQKLEYDLVPEKIGLDVGDEIEFWGVAVDSKLPEPNVAVTEKRVFLVVEATENPSTPNENDQSNESNQGDQGEGENNQAGAESGANNGSEGQGESGEEQGQQESQNSDGGENGNSGTSSDGAGESGEASESDEASENADSGADSSSGASSKENQSTNSSDNSESPSEGGASDSGESDASDGGDSVASPNTNAENDDSHNSEQKQSGAGTPNNSPGENSADDAADESSEGMNEGDVSQQAGRQSDASGRERESSQQDAFEKILDYMERERSGEQDAPFGNETNGDENAPGQHGTPRKGDEPTDERDGAAEAQEEAAPNFESNADLPTPGEKRNLPTRTSPERPSENADVFQADNPDKLDPNTRRQETDEFDETTNNFLGQNAPSGATESNSGDRRNKNITLDPLDQSQGMAADKIDPNAGEAKGGATNDVPDAPSEVDRSGAEAAGSNSQSSQESGKPNAPSDDSSASEGAQHSQKSDEKFGQGASGADNQNDQNNEHEDKRPNQSQSGKSNRESPTRGGGSGGSGLGELVAGEQTLAPADAPKLQYAEQATNLALEYLDATEPGRSREKLLDELGWTDAELREFIARWRRMRDEALGGDDPAAKREYLDSLEKLRFSGKFELGLDDSRAVESTFEANADHRAAEGSSEAARFKTPPRLEERVRAFTRGVSRQTAR